MPYLYPSLVPYDGTHSSAECSAHSYFRFHHPLSKDACLSSSDRLPETFQWHLLMKLLLKGPLLPWAFLHLHLFLTLQSIVVYSFNFPFLCPLSRGHSSGHTNSSLLHSSCREGYKKLGVTLFSM